MREDLRDHMVKEVLLGLSEGMDLKAQREIEDFTDSRETLVNLVLKVKKVIPECQVKEALQVPKVILDHKDPKVLPEKKL